MSGAAPAAPAWERLDPRMLLVHPIQEVGKFLPILVGLFLAGGAAGFGPWTLLGAAAPVALGVVRYLTTTWRITPDRVELRRGVLQRHTLSTPPDRVRTVDLTSSPIHRILGLATVVIGTGSVGGDAAERLELDALPREQATALQRRLLHAPADRRGADVGAVPGRPVDPTRVDSHDAPPFDDHVDETVVARFAPRWLWYAPFSGTVVVAAGALLGVLAQFAGIIEVQVDQDDLPVLDGGFVTVLAVGVVVLAIALSIGGYLVTNGGFQLSRQRSVWHVRRGLLTRRETSIDVARLAGVTVGEPAALRLARGRRLGAIVTGLPGDQSRSAALLPPAPAATVTTAAGAVLGTDNPITSPLLAHGRAATIRRYTRAALGVSPVLVLVVVAVALDGSPWLVAPALVAVLVAAALATDRARALGHALVDAHVVTRSGSLLRSRDALAAPHVIGWTLRATWFQRRAALVTMSATTAGGSGRIGVPDVPETSALALALAATPGLLDDFLEETA